MYTAVIEERFKASHALSLFPVPHSHEWVIRLTLESETLVEPGVIADYFALKAMLKEHLPPDGTDLNTWPLTKDVVPTAENFAKLFYTHFKPLIPQLVAVGVGEFPEFVCTYKPD